MSVTVAYYIHGAKMQPPQQVYMQQAVQGPLVICVLHTLCANY